MLSWTVHLKGAPKNIYHVAVAVGLDVYSFGGGYQNMKVLGQNEVHIFNTVSLLWKQLPPVTTVPGKRPLVVPSIHEGYTAVLIGDLVYIWGGCNLTWGWKCYNTLYTFDVNTHRWLKPKVSGSVPAARGNHSACASGKAMYVYGGLTRQTGNTNSIYALDTATMVWSLIVAIGTPPPATSLHSSSVIGTKMFVFGGLGEDGFHYDVVSAFDTETNSWLNTPTAGIRPGARFGHSSFAYDGELYVFGGGDSNGYFNDLWKFDPEDFSWRLVEPRGAGPYQECWRCCCAVGDRVVLFRDHLYILDFRPTLKTLCKASVVRHGLKLSGLPHNIRWEMQAMRKRTKKNGMKPTKGGHAGGNRRL